MPEYVKLEVLKEAFRSVTNDCTCPIHLAAEIDQILDQSPAADVAPVRHGRWERTADGAALCTACKRKMNLSQYGYAFCSLCGARMDGE